MTATLGARQSLSPQSGRALGDIAKGWIQGSGASLGASMGEGDAILALPSSISHLVLDLG